MRAAAGSRGGGDATCGLTHFPDLCINTVLQLNYYRIKNLTMDVLYSALSLGQRDGHGTSPHTVGTWSAELISYQLMRMMIV